MHLNTILVEKPAGPSFPPSNLLMHLDSDFSDATGRHVPTTVGPSINISTGAKKFGSASAYMNNTSPPNYIQITDNLDDFTWDGDFTIDFWFYPLDLTNTPNLYNVGNNTLNIYGPNNGQICIYSNGNYILGDTVALGVWQHIALTRSGSNVILFINGNQSGSTWVTSQTFTPSAQIYIGNYFNSGQQTFGYLDEYHVVKGTALWTAPFTPPSAPYTS